ncbi:peptidase M48 [Pusillimonas sp. T2]|uniref:M48 family metallopeptidase n=1 Tax=Pusillimonas sp. T2 TaxID=1548123 RepID=UPI000B9CAE34|nr:M48 family metallopeptidase [Pusillimonas sp. T2]OXR48351.1 peptidase M48 [Pusillimonas sp. T2]
MKSVAIRRFLSAGAAVLALTLAGCAAVQTTNSGAVGIQRQQYMSSLVSEQQLQQEAASQYSTLISQARAQGALDVNAAQTRRVQAIAQRLIAQVGVFRPDAAQWNWQVHVLKSNEVNAWCMPGGKIAVYTGLIDKLNASDAELAAVIGHEIAHALREHAREQVSQQMAANIGLSVLAAVTGSQASADLGGALTNVMFTLPNSRTHEIEADRMGVELAARAGYDPYAAVTLWQKMSVVSGGAGQPEFLSTHPSADTRIADLQNIAAQMMPLYQQSRR